MAAKHSKQPDAKTRHGAKQTLVYCFRFSCHAFDMNTTVNSNNRQLATDFEALSTPLPWSGELAGARELSKVTSLEDSLIEVVPTGHLCDKTFPVRRQIFVVRQLLRLFWKVKLSTYARQLYNNQIHFSSLNATKIGHAYSWAIQHPRLCFECAVLGLNAWCCRKDLTRCAKLTGILLAQQEGIQRARAPSVSRWGDVDALTPRSEGPLDRLFRTGRYRLSDALGCKAKTRGRRHAGNRLFVITGGYDTNVDSPVSPRAEATVAEIMKFSASPPPIFAFRSSKRWRFIFRETWQSLCTWLVWWRRDTSLDKMWNLYK